MRISGSPGPVELVMPSWTPGSYLLREFARNVQDFRAETPEGEPVAWTKTTKSAWRVEAPPAGELRVVYRVYANEATVRTSHLDASHAHVNGASVFLFVRGRESEPVDVEVEAPSGWYATTAMSSDAPFRFRARDYDELVDSPIEIGTHELLEWEQSGIPHRFAIWGKGSYDARRLVEDTKKIVATAERMFGGLPYPRYVFILHLLPEGRGGLEHRDSTVLQHERWGFEGEDYENLLALIAHEFFHVWNAKRIRPATLGPFDYTAENYTTNLWVVEGLTTYYTDLLLARAGIITAERYLARLGEAVSRFQALPGRRHQTLADSSFDTWIRFYRPDEHTPNAQISYYQKGALVGLLLDLEIRRSTGNERSLDDLLRTLWERYGVWDVGYPETGEGSVEALASEVAGTDLSPFFDRYIRGTSELEYARHLATAGVEMDGVADRPSGGVADDGSAESAREPARAKRPADAEVLEVRLGIRAREQGGRLRVANVFSEGPGWHGGLNAHDEIVAVDGSRVSGPTDLAKRIWSRPGATTSLTIFRRDELATLTVSLGAGNPGKVGLRRVDFPTEAQEAVWKGWVGEAASLDPSPAAG